MERIQSQDHQAFSVLVDRHTDKFYGAAYRMVMNRETAEDITQDAFLKLWESPKIWKKNRGAKFTTWFYRIITNQSLDFLRKSKKQIAGGEVEDFAAHDTAQDKQMEQNEEQLALDKALKTLPENQLIALNLCFFEGVSNKDAADIMKVNVKALESLLMRGKTNLKEMLTRQGVIEQIIIKQQKGEVA